MVFFHVVFGWFIYYSMLVFIANVYYIIINKLECCRNIINSIQFDKFGATTCFTICEQLTLQVGNCNWIFDKKQQSIEINQLQI